MWWFSSLLVAGVGLDAAGKLATRADTMRKARVKRLCSLFTLKHGFCPMLSQTSDSLLLDREQTVQENLSTEEYY